MNKTVVLFILISVVLSTFVGCNKQEETNVLLNTDFSQSPYFDIVEGGTILTNSYLENIISKIPSEQYEAYPNLHNIPQGAKLYKNEKVIEIDLTDQRLIALINFYNNSVHHQQYAYTQGLLDIDYLNENFIDEEFRLVIIFTPKVAVADSNYDTDITAYDTFIVTNKGFALIAHEWPGYEGQEEKYPFMAVGHFPLFYDYNWLDLFGF